MTLAITPPILSFGHSGVEYENGRIRLREVLEIIADNLTKAGWSWGCVSAIDSNRRTRLFAHDLVNRCSELTRLTKSA
jgi:hypothetical protein